MSERFSIRESTPDDADIICAHRRAMFEAMGRDTPAQIDAMDQPYRVWLADKLANGEYRAWFVENESGKVVAGAGLWLIAWPPSPYDQARWRGYVLNVYTEPAFRGRGFAKRLMQTIMAWCRAHSICLVTLHASNEGKPIYESLGFKQTNEMRIFLEGVDR
ncbi:MAG: GNAT family N-acetyltransferase [Chloroflexi bacterium]|nr:GNAT family N-acetyltransferase [Chloroflexota bacterium]